MKTCIYTRHRFHPDIVSYETIRRRVDKFGSTYVKRIKSKAEHQMVYLSMKGPTKLGGASIKMSGKDNRDPFMDNNGTT